MADGFLILNLQQFADEKTEKATPRKRREVRRKGKVAKSNEINTALVLLFSFLMLKIFGSYIGTSVLELFRTGFTEYLLQEINEDALRVMGIDLLTSMVLILLPIMLIAMVAGVVANLVQTGFMLTGEPLKIKLEKINPLAGLKRMFSARSLVELVKSVVKISAISLVAYLCIWNERETIFLFNRLEILDIVVFSSSLAIEIGWRAALVLLVFAVPDYAYQKYEHEKSIRMSKKDIKDEYKRTEGDPKIKSKRQAIQRRMAVQRMMSNVPKADVVITNPTHYSVALQYDAENMNAPMVVAKGVDATALRIREIAEEHQIPLVENRPLAQTLYKTIEVGEYVPEDLFQAVAEILAYVYKLKGKA